MSSSKFIGDVESIGLLSTIILLIATNLNKIFELILAITKPHKRLKYPVIQIPERIFMDLPHFCESTQSMSDALVQSRVKPIFYISNSNEVNKHCLARITSRKKTHFKDVIYKSQIFNDLFVKYFGAKTEEEV